MARRGSPWLAAAALALLAGCSEMSSLGSSVGSTVSGWFTSSKPKPKPLEPITSPIAGRQVWSQRVDSVRFPLTVSVRDGVFTVAGTDGTVVALQADTGREVWRANVGAKLSAGVGSDGKVAAVVTRDNELVVLAAGGQVKWRKPLGVRVATAPLVAGERVFVLSVDRAVQAFDENDGSKIWVLKRPGDPLMLAQTGVLSAYKDTLIVGQGPRMTGVDPLRGTVRWEVPVATPRGANEIERLADLVGPAVRVGNLVCARSFQAAVGCVDAERGALGWSKVVGGTEGIAADDQFVVAADATDRISAWKTSNGEVAWTSEKLIYRDLSTPLAVGPMVVFGDGQGTLHWLARDTGATRLRLPTDGSAIAAGPVVSGTTLLAVTRNGGLYAFRPE
ncbi:MAG: outer membrane protein assembly factor BamB [Proteobacteria bacterium]|nr:outer membrane protein assembly factor BamB [Pseudomonadota bacterium]